MLSQLRESWRLRTRGNVVISRASDAKHHQINYYINATEDPHGLGRRYTRDCRGDLPVFSLGLKFRGPESFEDLLYSFFPLTLRSPYDAGDLSPQIQPPAGLGAAKTLDNVTKDTDPSLCMLARARTVQK